MMWEVSAAVVMVMVMVMVAGVVAQDQDACSIPSWPNSTHPSLGPNPFEAARGKMLLVHLGKGYCGYCVRQAEGLEEIKTRLAQHGMTDFDVLVVNGGEQGSRDNVHNFRDNTNLTVLQDTEDNVLYSQVFHGNKDDFIIFDRCGQRTMYIPHPYSYLGYRWTLRAITRVYRGHHSCFCGLDYTGGRGRRADRMQGDQPVEERAGRFNRRIGGRRPWHGRPGSRHQTDDITRPAGDLDLVQPEVMAPPRGDLNTSQTTWWRRRQSRGQPGPGERRGSGGRHGRGARYSNYRRTMLHKMRGALVSGAQGRRAHRGERGARGWRGRMGHGYNNLRQADQDLRGLASDVTGQGEGREAVQGHVGEAMGHGQYGQGSGLVVA